MTIELRLSEVNPPLPDPQRTIYRDILNLPDPVQLGLTVRYFNHDDVGLYFQITGSSPGYTFDTVNLGLLANGANAYINLDEFASRAKPSAGDLPSGEREEAITLTLRAYTDAGYTILKWTFSRIVTVHWINSADAAFTVDELDNFDDGTVQGWAAVLEQGFGAAIGVATDYVLSPAYALRGGPYERQGAGWSGEVRGRIQKAFTTADKPTVYAIFDIRLALRWVLSSGSAYLKYCEIERNGTILVHLGKAYAAGAPDDVPRDKWMRVVVPLPRNTALTLRVRIDSWWSVGVSQVGAYQYADIYMDDFKIISK